MPSGLVHRRCLPRSSLACHAQQQHEAPRFDLPLAVGLAGAAFEAYLEPLGGAGFEDMALNGSRTVFMDRHACVNGMDVWRWLELWTHGLGWWMGWVDGSPIGDGGMKPAPG